MNTRRLFLLLGIGLLLLLPAGVLATEAGNSLDWWTVDGGGGSSSGGEYALEGTLGQPDAGVLSGREYTLVGGFWGGEVAPPPPPPEWLLYLPQVRR